MNQVISELTTATGGRNARPWAVVTTIGDWVGIVLAVMMIPIVAVIRAVDHLSHRNRLLGLTLSGRSTVKGMRRYGRTQKKLLGQAFKEAADIRRAYLVGDYRSELEAEQAWQAAKEAQERVFERARTLAELATADASRF